jgi:hypothetical protein
MLLCMFSTPMYRRLRMLQAEGGIGMTLPMAKKPTPAEVIRTLPVLPYAAALQQLNSHAHADNIEEAKAEPGQKPTGATHKSAPPTPATPEPDSSNLPDAGGHRPINLTTATIATDSDCLQQQQHEGVASQAAILQSPAASQAQGQQHWQPTEAACTASTPLEQQAQPDVDDSDNCPICFCEYSSNTPVKQLPCKHFYHSECIDQWLTRDNTCPLCKAPVWQQPLSGARLHSRLASGEGTTGTSRVAIINHHTGLHLVVFVPTLGHQLPGAGSSSSTRR